jgi:hypothetical protein
LESFLGNVVNQSGREFGAPTPSLEPKTLKINAEISLLPSPEQRDLMSFKEGQAPVIEQVGGSDRMPSFIKFGEGHPTVSVDKGLLINTADALDIADVVVPRKRLNCIRLMGMWMITPDAVFRVHAAFT